MSRATIMAVVNQKGGTGKTTTCENLGIGLANEGKRVLLVDTDPQASLTIALGHPRPDDLPVTLTDLMAKVMQDQPIAPKEGILSHEEGVDLVPANITLSGMEVSLVNAMSRETVLRQVLDALKYRYDYILLDCMPSLGMLTVNALAASDQVLIPVQANYLSAKGLEQLLQTVNKVKRQINPKLRIEGILLTKLNLLPCDMYFVNKIGKLGTDFNTAEEFVAWREKQPYKKVIEEIDQLPSEKCKQCQYYERCYGGCPVLWKNYSFEDLENLKKKYH